MDEPQQADEVAGASPATKILFALGATLLLALVLVALLLPVEYKGNGCGSVVFGDDDAAELRDAAADARGNSEAVSPDEPLGEEFAEGFSAIADDAEDAADIIEQECPDARNDRALILALAAILPAGLLIAGWWTAQT